MAINYATKYSSKVDERFKIGAITDKAINREYDFEGVRSINIYSIATSAMNNYSMTGNSRYGTPAELDSTTQIMTLNRDRSFTFTIDRRNYEDTQMTHEAGRALARQIDEVIIPEIDVYRLSKIVAGAGYTTIEALDSTNAYSSFLKGITIMLGDKVPHAGLVAYVSANFYQQIRLDPAFIKASDMAQKMLVKGQVGMIEGIPIIYTPFSYLPSKVEFVITHPSATVAAEKLVDYKIHDNPVGINGWVIEGRLYYDAFVLESKKKAIYVHRGV